MQERERGGRLDNDGAQQPKDQRKMISRLLNLEVPNKALSQVQQRSLEITGERRRNMDTLGSGKPLLLRKKLKNAKQINKTKNREVLHTTGLLHQKISQGKEYTPNRSYRATNTDLLAQIIRLQNLGPSKE